MDNSCLGSSRSINIEDDDEEEPIASVVIDLVEELETALAAEDEEDQTEEKAKIIDLEDMNRKKGSTAAGGDELDSYQQREDYWNEYIPVSHSKANEPPAVCLNVEEIGRVFDEVFAYLLFQQRGILEDYVTLSFTEMKAWMDDYRAPFGRRNFFCPVFVDEESKLPRVPSKDECLEWASGDGRA